MSGSESHWRLVAVIWTRYCFHFTKGNENLGSENYFPFRSTDCLQGLTWYFSFFYSKADLTFVRAIALSLQALLTQMVSRQIFNFFFPFYANRMTQQLGNMRELCMTWENGERISFVWVWWCWDFFHRFKFNKCIRYLSCASLLNSKVVRHTVRLCHKDGDLQDGNVLELI